MSYTTIHLITKGVDDPKFPICKRTTKMTLGKMFAVLYSGASAIDYRIHVNGKRAKAAYVVQQDDRVELYKLVKATPPTVPMPTGGSIPPAVSKAAAAAPSGLKLSSLDKGDWIRVAQTSRFSERKKLQLGDVVQVGELSTNLLRVILPVSNDTFFFDRQAETADFTLVDPKGGEFKEGDEVCLNNVGRKAYPGVGEGTLRVTGVNQVGVGIGSLDGRTSGYMPSYCLRFITQRQPAQPAPSAVNIWATCPCCMGSNHPVYGLFSNPPMSGNVCTGHKLGCNLGSIGEVIVLDDTCAS